MPASTSKMVIRGGERAGQGRESSISGRMSQMYLTPFLALFPNPGSCGLALARARVGPSTPLGQHMLTLGQWNKCSSYPLDVSGSQDSSAEFSVALALVQQHHHVGSRIGLPIRHIGSVDISKG